MLVKAPGIVSLNPETGRMTTTFDGLPPAPNSLATFAFNQGANAPLVTPPTCGDYTVTAQLTPWRQTPNRVATGTAGPAVPYRRELPGGERPAVQPGRDVLPDPRQRRRLQPLLPEAHAQRWRTGDHRVRHAVPAGLDLEPLGRDAECGEGEVQRAREQTGVEAETSPACPGASLEIGYSIAEAGVGSVLAQTPGKIYLGGPDLRRAVLGRGPLPAALSARLTWGPS